jgi:cellulose synthase/poly-beta-1,6-N-acetylglucosamine synthase-like glycosyltransferase
MADGKFQVNRGVNKSIEFKGFKAQYIWWLAGGIVLTLILFAVIYIAGVNQYACVLFAIASISFVVLKTFRLSKKYGEYGMMKKIASKNIPTHIRSRSRKSFFK